jgi:hypothetical protein
MRRTHPTPRRILEAAAKLRLNVRIELGADGEVRVIETVGEVGRLAAGGATTYNPWDEVLGEDQKRSS